MRKLWLLGSLLCAGCLPTVPEDPHTQQVASATFNEPRTPAPTRVNYAPATPEVSFRVVMLKDKLLGENPQVSLRPRVTAVGSPDPEIFHIGAHDIFITEGLVRQCQTEGQLAAVLAYEMGRMISERESRVADEVRNPEQLLPIDLRIGSNGNSSDSNPLGQVELARFEKAHPKRTAKLASPNPQLIARSILERGGYQPTDLDAVLPLLQNAERFQAVRTQFNGPAQRNDWKAP